MIGKKREIVVKALLSITLIAISALIPLSPIHAISGDGLIAYPTNPDPKNSLTESWFIYNLDRGETKQDSLTLKNESDKRQTMKIYAVDSTTNNVGEFALKNEKDEKEGLGKWIQMETDTITLEPNEKKEIKFTTTIPQDAIPGEIAGGIIIQKEMTEEQKNAKSGFVITTRIGIRVYETVPGEIVQKLSFGNAWIEYDKDNKGYILNVNVKNEGSTSVEPEMKVEVKDAIFGKQNDILTQKTMIPRGAEVKMTFLLSKARFGKFSISPVLSYGKDKTQTITYPHALSLIALPWDALQIIGLLLFINILLVIFLKLSSRREKKHYKTYIIQKEDNLELLAHKFNMDWKKIAKINKLKPPYQLAEGQRLTVIDKQDIIENMVFEKSQWSEESIEESEGKWTDWTEEKAETHNTNISSKKTLFIIALLTTLSAIGLIYSSMTHENNTIPDTDKAQTIVQNDENMRETNKENDTDKENEQQNNQDPEEVENTEAATPSATPEPLSASDRTKVRIEIQNGGGIKGASAKASSLFTAEGYTYVSSGNADSFNHTQTTIECAADIDPRVCEEAQSLIVGAYPNATVAQTGEVKNGTIRIIIGR